MADKKTGVGCMMCSEMTASNETRMCPSCERIQKSEKKEIESLQNNGHPHHCACRQVWGDGECECDLYLEGYDPYAWANPEDD